MPFSVEEARRLIASEDVALKSQEMVSGEDLLDRTTRSGKDNNYISDVGFFSLFSNIELRALDITDYEGAEIIHDMHEPIPDDLVGASDFIFNGGCMDNMFDPATALKNCARMLSPNGRLMLIEYGTPHHAAYTMYSPAYFFDYFAINQFVDCRVYICMLPPESVFAGTFDLFCWRDFGATLHQFPIHLMPPNWLLMSLVLAERDADSTWHRSPVQGQYRPDQTSYRDAFARFAQSPRPALRRSARPEATTLYAPFLDGNHPHVEFIGSLEGASAY